MLTSTIRRRLSTGVSFTFTDEQLQLKATTRKFVKEHIIPVAAKYDKTMEFPWEIVKKAHDTGLVNFSIPKQFGGLDLNMVSASILSDELGYGCAAIGSTILVNDLAESPLILCASEDIKSRFLPRMIEEPLMAAYAVTEPSAGSDVAGIKTRAEKKGDEWVINGQKMWITNAGVANWFIVLARTDTDPKTPPGKAFTAFVVEGDTPGITRGRKEIHMGLRCADNRGLIFEDVRVPETNIIGAVGEGFKVAMKTFDKTRLTFSALTAGIHRRCLDEATRHALERKTFGVQLARHHGVQAILTNMAITLELSRLAVLKVFGGAGFNTEYPAEKLMRDVKIFQIGEGSTQIQQLIIGRRLLEKYERDGYFD